jgi:hypothetical protein
MEAAILRENTWPHAITKNTRPRVCKRHASVNLGACTACVLTEYYEKQLALRDEKIQMLKGTVDQLQQKLDSVGDSL